MNPPSRLHQTRGTSGCPVNRGRSQAVIAGCLPTPWPSHFDAVKVAVDLRFAHVGEIAAAAAMIRQAGLMPLPRSPYVPPDEAQHIAELGTAARRWVANHYAYCADLYRWEMKPNSRRSTDRLTQHSGPAGPWGEVVHGDYVSIVCQYMSAAADLLDGFGAACLAGAVQFPPLVLARASLEYSTRAAWLLDRGCRWRQRAARAHLELLFGIEERVKGMPKTVDGTPNESRAAMKRYRKEFREDVIPGLFESVEADDPETPDKQACHTIIEGEQLKSLTDASRFYERVAFGEGINFYDGLSAFSHPNPAVSRFLAKTADDDDGTPFGRRFEASAELLALALTIAIVALLKLEFEWAEYSGWDDTPLRDWEDDVATILPNAYGEVRRAL
jgi:hypothetical protein